MRHVTVFFLLFTTFAFGLQAGAAVAPHPSPFKMLRSVAGGKSAKTAGGFHISDPRSTFYLPEDTKVIVYMEWEGPPGKHTVEAYWHNPAGKTVVISDFAYETKPQEKRYGGYMELNLNPEVLTGMWQMEARIDGEVLGVHTFEVVNAAKPSIKEDSRTTLSVGELYTKANAATVVVEALDADNKVFRSGLGFPIKEDALLTAFQVIDGATTVRIRFRGQDLLVSEMLAGDRWQDWALLPINNGTPIAKSPTAGNVGDRATTLNLDQAGNRTIVDGAIVGRTQGGRSGERLKIASSLPYQAIGAPLLNEYGEAVGMIGGVVLAGARSMLAQESASRLYLGFPGNVLNTNIVSYNNDTAVPIDKVATTWSRRTPFEELTRAGVFTPPVAPRIRIGRGTLCRDLSKDSSPPAPIDERFDFAPNQNVIVYIQWAPTTKDKGTATVQIFNSENKPVTEGKATKVSLSAKEYAANTWKIPLTGFAPDVYRVDLVLDGVPAWRSYFRVTR